MVIRRIREHVSTHNWFAVGVDVVIVVLGVVLGTQVNNWNEARLEAERGRHYRDRLISELDFDAHQYAVQAAYYRQARAYGLQALAALEGKAPNSDRNFVIAAYQLQSRIRRECGDRNVFYKGRIVGIRVVVPCPMVIRGDEAAQAAAAVRAAPDIHRQMTRYISSIDEKLDNLDFAAVQAVQFRDRLKGSSRRRTS